MREVRGVREILLHDDLGDERHQPTRCATSLLADIPQREKLPLTLDSKCGLWIAALHDLCVRYVPNDNFYLLCVQNVNPHTMFE